MRSMWIVEACCASTLRTRSRLRRAVELGDGAAGGGVLDERRQPPLARLLLLRAGDPPAGGLPVPGRLLPPELPRRGVRAQLARVRLGQVLVPLLVGIDGGLVRRARLERLLAGRAHPPLGAQLAHAADVHGAPGAARLPRGEADGVRLVAQRPPHPIDPPEAERL